MIIIYHNPDCETSRNVLNVITASGYSPTVVEYIKEGWDASELELLLLYAGLTPRQALRITKSPAEQLGLLDPTVTDDEIFQQMLKHPILVNRPIVCTPLGIALCRPSETVLKLLEKLPTFKVYKEGGELII